MSPSLHRIGSALLLILLLSGVAGKAIAQDLEPRRWSHLPVGLNVIGVGLGSSSGDILFDPVMQIEDATFDITVAGVSYVRAFDLGGKTARLDVLAPVVKGKWEGLLEGEPAQAKRQGLADPWIRFSVNLYGAPALKGEEYMKFVAGKESNTTIGAGLTVIAPLGEYSQERLINLGNNRWVIRPQLGILHQRRKWQFELTGSVFLYQKNKEFWQGTVRKQDPLWFLQSHVIYTFNPKWWGSMSFGFANGGRSTINGSPARDDARISFMAASVGFNINQSQGMKFSWLRSRTNTSLGKDTDIFSLGWSFRWAR